ncbi:chaperonin 10-like protein, partial [Mycena olivaceomarginata]
RALSSEIFRAYINRCLDLFTTYALISTSASTSTISTSEMSLPTTTRQYVFPGKRVPLSALKANEVLVKTHAVSLQFRDLMIASGKYPGNLPRNLVPCSDMAGEVIAVGEGVKEWKAGDRLGGSVQGVLTEYRAFPAQALVEIPDHLSYEEASKLPCAALTAYNALLSGYEPLKAGDTFAVASGGDHEKLKTATKLGAKHVINYKTTPDWAAEVVKLTNGLGVDRVVEVVGNATLKQSLAAVRNAGSIDIIGVLGGLGDVPAVDIIGACIFKQIKIRGIYVGSVVQFKNMTKLIAANPATTRPVIDKVFGFDSDVKAAYAHLASQKHVGKVVIRL